MLAPRRHGAAADVHPTTSKYGATAMNRILNTLIVSIAAMTTSLASAADSSTGSMSWPCSRQGVASYAEIKSELGIANFYQARQAQGHIYHVVQRACARESVRSVLLVSTPAQKNGSRIAAR
jgi:hypothetical protein